MPRPAKPPRLEWVKEYRNKDGSINRVAGWYIIDRGKQFSTGCGASEPVKAQKVFSDWLVKNSQAPENAGRPPSEVLISEAVEKYSTDIVGSHAKPQETAGRLMPIVVFFAS